MWIEVFGLSCLLSILEAHKLPTTPAFNPECTGMKIATTHLKSGIQALLQKSSNCQPNPHCTGVKCTWSDGGYLEIDLHHCTDPVNYHVYVNAPGKGISNNVTLKQGDEKELSKRFKIHVTELSRKGNQVTTTVKLEACLNPLPCTSYTLLDQKFCVRMQNCPGFNASTTDYKPCSYKPTGHPVDHTTKHTFRPTSSSGHSKSQTSSLATSSTGHPVDHTTNHTFRPTSSSGHSKSQTSSLATSSTDYPPTASIAAQKGKHPKGKVDDDSKKLSTAAIIGICAASMFAILVVLAAAVYWKKYHHRSRLRAAYYNDISMHDPLYEDFGPEVA